MQIIHPDVGVYIHSNNIELSTKVQLKLKFQEGGIKTAEDIHLDSKKATLKDARTTIF